MKKFAIFLFSCLAFLAGSGGEMLWWRVTDTTRKVVQEYVQETSKDSDGNIILITNDDGTPKMVWKDKLDEHGNTVYEITGCTKVDGEQLSSFVLPYQWSKDGYSGYDVGARVRVQYKDGSSEILPTLQSSSFGSWEEVPYAVLGDPGDGNGLGTGDFATQTPLPSSELLQEAMFLIELGELTYSDILDDYEFTKLIAESDPYSY